MIAEIIKEKICKKLTVHYEDENAREKLFEYLHEIVNDKEHITVVCIGTDRVTGDCLGPLVGTMIEDIYKDPRLTVLGTLKQPVHARNIHKKVKNIDKDSFVIAVDAALGTVSRVGSISITQEPLRPGTGLDKNLGRVGDINITGIVNTSNMMSELNFNMLLCTRLGIVWEMAQIISDVIIDAVFYP